MIRLLIDRDVAPGLVWLAALGPLLLWRVNVLLDRRPIVRRPGRLALVTAGLVALAPSSPVLARGAVAPRVVAAANGRAAVIVDEDGHLVSAAGTGADLQAALAARAATKGAYVWIRREDRQLVTTAPASIARVRALLDQQRGLRQREVQLGSTQVEQGQRQAQLRERQTELGQRQAELGRQQAELGQDRNQLQIRKRDRNLRQIDAVPPELLHRLLDEEARSESALVFARSQHELGQRQNELGRQQAELGRQQGELGRQQDELGRQQGELARQRALLDTELASQIDRLFDEEALRAHPVDGDR
jgi:septal ring factor EnvC (AmiA/AmiB activator)